MTTTNGTVGDQVEGLVEARNDRGIRVSGEWRNLSKFHPLELPGQGARVRVELDSKGFIRTLQVLDVAPAADGGNSLDRDRTIRRQVAIKTAAQLVGAFAQCREDVKTEHIFPLADRILAWLEQEGDQQPT